MVSRVLVRAWLAAFTFVLSGCVQPISEAESTVGKKKRDCIVPVPAEVRALGAPVSLDYPAASLWIWDSVTTSDGTVIPNASARISDGGALCASGPELARTADGAPQSLLSLSADELAANAARTDGRHLALSAHGGFVSSDIGYLYYEHNLLGPGVFDVEPLGTGLCLVSAPDQPCERLERAGSTVLWPPDAWPKNQGGLVQGERAFLLGCRHLASFDDPCVISSVSLDQVGDPAAYRYFNAFSDWVESPDAASVVLNLSGAITLSQTDARYVATSLDIFDATFRVRFAGAPTGDFGMPVDLFQGQPPRNGFAQGGRAHQALRANDRSLTLSYFVADDGPGHGLHLIDFELNRGLQ